MAVAIARTALKSTSKLLQPCRYSAANLRDVQVVCDLHVTRKISNANIEEYSEKKNLVPFPEDAYRERFIPLTRRYTVSLLLQDDVKLSDTEKKDFEKFALALDAVVSTRYASTVQELKQLYDSINPDKETLVQHSLPTQDRLENEFWFLQRLSMMMEKANFYELSTQEVLKKLAEHETHGVKVSVDYEDYDVLRYWVLGKERNRLSYSLSEKLIRLLRRESLQTASTDFKRVIAAVRLKSDDKLSLKAFKDVESADLEKVLPAGKIGVGRFDRNTMIVSLSLSGIGLLAKLVTVLAKMTVNWPIGFAAVSGLLGVRGYVAHKNRKASYLSMLNKMLYYKNISNNRGLITLVADRAEDESFKEALLTYCFIKSLSQTTDTSKRAGVSIVSLENSIEDWLLNITGVAVEFDSADSVSLLEQIGILNRSGEGSQTMLSVMPLEAAHRLLPQTPLAVITRIQDSDVIEGYDKSRLLDDAQNKLPKKTWLPKINLFSRFR